MMMDFGLRARTEKLSKRSARLAPSLFSGAIVVALLASSGPVFAQFPGGFSGGGGGRGNGGRLQGTPGRALTPADVPSFPDSIPLYDIGTLRTIFFQFASPDWEQQLTNFYNTDVELPATVMVDGKSYPDVGVSFRGNSSYRGVPFGTKRSLNVSIDMVHEDQSIGGYRTLNLLNANNDPTFLRTVFYSHVARHYLPAPKVNYVRVVINGENWGIYLNVQQFNKDFTREFFGDDDGMRWKVPGNPRGRAGLEYLGEGAGSYQTLYEIRSKDTPESWTALVELLRVLDQTPPEQLEARLAPIFDVDGALRFIAVDMALANSDGYWTRGSDYSLFRGEDGRFHVIPYDMNEGLGVGLNSYPHPLVAAQDPSKPLHSKLLAVPALRARYREYVRDIAENFLDWRKVEPLLREYHALIANDIADDTRKMYSTQEFHAELSGPGNTLQAFLEARQEYLLRRLSDLD